VLLGCTIINIIALALKDYSVLYYSDYLQFLASFGVFAMFIGLCRVFYKLKKASVG
jgi:Tfp pilus assembly protein PilZ